MATYWDDFLLDAPNAAPNAARWTPYGFADHSAYLTGKVQDEGSGIHAVELRDTGWGGYNTGYTRAELGTYSPGGAETIEIAIHFRFPSGQGNSAGGIKWGNYYATPTDGTNWALLYGIGGSYVAGTGANAYTVTSNTWWWARMQRSGTGVFKLRLWDASGAEPGSWLITSSADTTATSGGLGFFSNLAYYTPVDVRNVGIGTGGDSAPTSAASSGGVPKIMQAHARRRR